MEGTEGEAPDDGPEVLKLEDEVDAALAIATSWKCDSRPSTGERADRFGGPGYRERDEELIFIVDMKNQEAVWLTLRHREIGFGKIVLFYTWSEMTCSWLGAKSLS